jgi:hypothetical protein
MKTELRPCMWDTFGIHTQKIIKRGGWFYVSCSCGTRSPANYTEETAITAWNNRPQTDKAVEMLEELRAWMDLPDEFRADVDAVIKELKGE